MSDSNTMIAVIGGGPGGYAAAFLAADLGMNVTLIDAEKNPGGVCLYRGCIPSKALLHVAKLLDESRHAKAWGIDFAEPKIDINRLRSWKESVVAKLTGGLGVLAKQRKVTYVQGRATFVNSNTLTVELTTGGIQQMQFDRIIIAVGSSPAKIPTFDIGSPRVMDSTGGLNLDDVPKSLLVVGGGYIGLELGTVYAALGSRVSVVEMLPHLMNGADRDLVAPLQKRISQRYEAIMLNTQVKSIRDDDNGVTVNFESKEAGAQATTSEKKYDRLLVCVGRKPNAMPGIENTQVKVTERGFIEVNKQLQTADPSIYAIGDVVGEPMLAHKASHEGRTAVEHIAGHKVAFEPNAIPAVVFTDPEIAWCGLTETQAQQEGREVTVAKFPWAASGRALTLDRTEGLTKLIIDPKTERVLGMGVVGAGAGELIAEGVLAVEMAALAKDIALTIHPHPTLSETVMNSAEVFFGDATDIYRPKRQATQQQRQPEMAESKAS